MHALVFRNGRLSAPADYPQPDMGAGDVLLSVRLAGVCSTDLEILRGYAGFEGVLGHEFVADVDDVGPDVDPAWLGRRVTGSINVGCGICPECLARGPEHCPSRTVIGIHNRDGAFAEYVTLPAANLYAVPDNVSDEAAVFTEPLAAALRIREQIRVRPTGRTAVVGPGRLGLLAGLVLARDGTAATMLGRNLASLDLPRYLGLNTGLTSDYADDSFDLVVEATGNEAGLAQSLRLVRPLGTLVLKSTFAGRSTVDLTKLVVGEITVVGSRCGPFGPALRLLADDAIPVTESIDAEYPLSDGVQAFAHAARPGVRKVLLRP